MKNNRQVRKSRFPQKSKKSLISQECRTGIDLGSGGHVPGEDSVVVAGRDEDVLRGRVPLQHPEQSSGGGLESILNHDNTCNHRELNDVYNTILQSQV